MANVNYKIYNNAPSFGVGSGILGDTIKYKGVDYSLVIQQDGKILLYTSDGTITRYNADGSRDSSFGVSGRIQTLITNSDADSADNSVALQADGKILVIGVYQFGGIIVSRFNSDGSLDGTFGENGSIIKSDDPSGRYTFYRPTSIAMQNDGKFLVSAAASDGDLSSIVLLRYYENGELDASFGVSGMISTQASREDIAKSIALQNDGKILVTASSRTFTGYEWVVVRYNSDGELDRSFGVDGIVRTRFGNVSEPYSVKVQDDGKIIVIGSSNEWFALARYNQNGSLDSSFDSGGKVLGNPEAWPSFSATPRVDFEIQSDGKIVVGGASYHNFRYHFTVGRFNSDGTVDNTFGDGGISFIESTKSDGYVGAIALQQNDKIVAVGLGSSESDQVFTAIMARLNVFGSLDLSFNGVSSLSGEVNFTEGGVPVVIDKDVQVSDEELINFGNYNSATLTLSRSGASDLNDKFSGAGVILGQATGNIVLSGIVVGKYVQDLGVIEIEFNSNATQLRVNQVLQSLAYQNISDAPPDFVHIVWTFNDGNIGAQGAGGQLITTGSSVVNILSVNDAPDGNVVISGSGVQGQPLTPINSFTDPDGIPNQDIQYIWFAEGSDIPIAYSSSDTSPSYVPKDAEVGKSLRVVASYLDGGGTREEITSELTQHIISNNPKFYIQTVIDGDGLYLTQGKTYAVGRSGLSEGDFIVDQITLFQGKKQFLPKTAPSALIRESDGSFGVLSKSGSAWTQQKFSPDGAAIGKAIKITLNGVLTLESQFDKDIDGDGAEGEVVAVILDGEAVRHDQGLYKTNAGNVVLGDAALESGNPISDAIVLMSNSKKAWMTPKASSVEGIAFTVGGNLEVLTRKGTAFTAQKFDEITGLMIGRAVKLKADQLEVREYYYDMDLTGDGVVSLVGQESPPTGWMV